MSRGVITLVFDDGYDRVFHNVLPILRQHHMSAVFALPLNAEKLAKSEQRKLKPWPEWLPITKEGHEIASHSVSHQNLANLHGEELDKELREPHEILQATTIVYPGGAVDDHVVQAAARYYTAGRTVHYGFESIPPQDPFHLKSYNFSRNNFSVTKANILALRAYLTNSWLIETYHMVDGADEEMVHTVKTEDFRRHIRFLAKLPVTVRTIRNVIEREVGP